MHSAQQTSVSRLLEQLPAAGAIVSEGSAAAHQLHTGRLRDSGGSCGSAEHANGGAGSTMFINGSGDSAAASQAGSEPAQHHDSNEPHSASLNTQHSGRIEHARSIAPSDHPQSTHVPPLAMPGASPALPTALQAPGQIGTQQQQQQQQGGLSAQQPQGTRHSDGENHHTLSARVTQRMRDMSSMLISVGSQKSSPDSSSGVDMQRMVGSALEVAAQFSGWGSPTSP